MIISTGVADMDFLERIINLANKLRQQKDVIDTEEATKNAFVMPFIHNILGYDVFDPTEVKPEFICDVGTKKGEKIDYAIIKDGEIQVLIECKKIGDPLNINHASQLFRYFHVTNARISILTNGQVYQFFTDLDAPNKMDEKPFLEFDLLNIEDNLIPELKKLTKSAFDIDSIISAAGELKYVSQIKKVLSSQLNNPEEDFVKFFASRVYDGMLTPKVKETFAVLTKKATTQFITDQVNERLKSAISSTTEKPGEPQERPADANQENEIITTEEELEGFYIVKGIIRTIIDPTRISQRDTKSYFGILIDDNNRKPVCRLHFNRAQKYIGIIDSEKNEVRHPISSIDDIYNYTEQLKETVGSYL